VHMNRLKNKYRFFTCILLSVLILISCSAYLNTFYNAEVVFKEANEAHKKEMRKFPDSLIAPSTEIATKYEKAIEKSIKVLETFNKKTKWHDDALFLMARAYYFKKDMTKAIRRLNELQQNFPSSPFIPQSYLYMAKAYIEDGNLNKAEEIIEMILQKYPALDAKQEVSFLLINIAIKRGGNSQAILLLEKAYKSAKSETKRMELILRLAELYIEMKQYSKAILLLEKTSRIKDLPEQSYRMDRALLDCYMEIDSLQKALTLADGMKSKKSYENHKEEILFKKAMVLSRLGRYDEAIDILRDLTINIDSSNVASDSSQIRARALFELAILYQKKKNDMENADKYFSLSSRSIDTLGREISKKRISALERLKKLREGKDSLDGPLVSRKYKIAELFKYELDVPDSAYYHYLELSKDSSADSDYISRAISAAAFVARDELKDTLRADSLFKLLISRFPATELAKDAQKQLGVKVTIKTRQDSAYEAFCRAEDLLYKNGDVKGAVQAYYNVYRNYPDLPIAPKSLFVAAWLSDDKLEKNKTAKMLYERICEKYPESEYCKEEAKQRIKIVEDTLKALEARRKNEEKFQKRPKTQKNKAVNDSLEQKKEDLFTGKEKMEDQDSLSMDEAESESGKGED